MSKINIEGLKFTMDEFLECDRMFISCNDPEELDFSLGGVERLHRLHRVQGFLCSKLNCSRSDLRKKFGVLGMHDHKGSLTVVWRSYRDFYNSIKHVHLAWACEFEDGVCSVVFTSNTQFYKVGGS
jgi:hypothetical protein